MTSHKKSLEQIAEKDPVLRKIIQQIKLTKLQRRTDYFQSLVNSIISQQLSTKAALSIRNKFVALFGGVFPSARQILKKSDSKLRQAGLSFGKISYIKNLAEAVERGSLDLKNIDRLSDEEIINSLVQIKGIGRWTAEMFLLFSLGRPDVFSHGDLGLKNAIKKLYRLDPKVHKKKYLKLIESWSPHNSLVSRILWKSLEIK